MDLLRNIVEEAIETGERRLVVLSGRDSLERAAELADTWLSKRDGKLLIATHSGAESERIAVDEGRSTFIGFDQTEEVLGGTWDILIADLSTQFRPNDLGRLIEVVRGGGLAILTIPQVDEWMSSLTEFQRKFLVPPFESRGIRQLFKARFLSSLGREGTFLIGDEVRGSLCGKVSDERKPVEKTGDPVLDLCATQDQQRVLRSILNAFWERKRVFILTANRGRGKSAVIGLALSLIMAKSRVRSAVVTSPSIEGIQTIFSFLMRGLDAQGLSYEPLIREGKVIDVRFRGKNVFYLTPESAAEADVSLKVIDEAASLPVTTLLQFMSTSRFAIFSSTVHGYEGAGRGFTLRFLARVRRSGMPHVEERMEEPVRYPPGDPVERWLYDFLLLNAEPGDPPSDLSKLNYNKISLDAVSEDYLRKFYGIYILAHYRNRPNDLATLLDAPHHFARALEADGEPVVSMHVAMEGGLPAQVLDEMVKGLRDLPGHMIPSRLVLHYQFKSFGKLRGWRIVRIATHPELQGMGLGSRALAELEEEARESGIDWVGAGFGASEELLRFWIRNGYRAVHMSPRRNPVTGEYSVLVLKPLSREAVKATEEVLKEFKRRLLLSLHDVYFSLNPMVARLLLAGKLEGGKAKLSNSQRSRLMGFVRGTYVYELASDSICEVVRCYFWRGGGCLTPREEALLIAKVLQGKPWETIRSRFGIKGDPYETMREVVSNLLGCLNCFSDET